MKLLSVSIRILPADPHFTKISIKIFINLTRKFSFLSAEAEEKGILSQFALKFLMQIKDGSETYQNEIFYLIHLMIENGHKINIETINVLLDKLTIANEKSTVLQILSLIGRAIGKTQITFSNNHKQHSTLLAINASKLENLLLLTLSESSKIAIDSLEVFARCVISTNDIEGLEKHINTFYTLLDEGYLVYPVINILASYSLRRFKLREKSITQIIKLSSRNDSESAKIVELIQHHVHHHGLTHDNIEYLQQAFQLTPIPEVKVKLLFILDEVIEKNNNASTLKEFNKETIIHFINLIPIIKQVSTANTLWRLINKFAGNDNSQTIIYIKKLFSIIDLPNELHTLHFINLLNSKHILSAIQTSGDKKYIINKLAQHLASGNFKENKTLYHAMCLIYQLANTSLFETQKDFQHIKLRSVLINTLRDNPNQKIAAQSARFLTSFYTRLSSF